jgi:hypothetical protein
LFLCEEFPQTADMHVDGAFFDVSVVTPNAV